MHLIIDCFKQVKGHGKSLGIYNLSRELVKNLAIARYDHPDERVRNARLSVIGTQKNAEDFNVDGADFISINNYDPLKSLDCLLWEVSAVKHIIRVSGADLALFPRGYLPLTGMRGHKMVPVVHDMIPFYYNEHHPDYFGRVHNAYIMRRLKGSIRSADRVITISEASKGDICHYTGVDGSKITVIYNGLTSVFVNKDEDRPAQSGDLPSAYIVAIASAYPHKNLVGVIRGYEAYCSRASSPLDLVVIGVDTIPPGIVTADTAGRIRCIRYIESDKQYQEIIAGSCLMLFLSLIEGFGFPPLEAMQLGMPVICSDRSSLPEIAGDAAVLVDPTDAQMIGKKIFEVLPDDNLKQELVRAGYENIKRFTWDVIAKRYWDSFLEMELR